MKTLVRGATALTLALASASSLADLYDARSGARAGTGQTMGDHAYISGNPALLGRSGQGRVAVALNAGVLLSDREQALDLVDELDEDIERLDEIVNEGGGTQSERDALADSILKGLEGLDDSLIQVNGGGILGVGVPGSPGIPLGVVIRRDIRVGVRTLFSEDDRELLEEVKNGQPFAEGDVQSELSSSAVDISELSLMGAKTLSLAGFDDVHLGAALKFQTIELIDYRRSLPDFEGDDIIDDSDNSREHSNLNVDLGIYKSFGVFSGAAMVRNLIPRSFSGPNHSYSMRPEIEVAGGADFGLLKAEAGIDLTPAKGYGDLEDTQFMRIGAEVGLRRVGQLRAGYRIDMLDNVAPVFTAGIGISPMGVVNLDLAVMTGEGDTFGAAVQLGTSF